MLVWKRILVVLSWLAIIPVSGYAQTLAGTVKDASGAVLPGVTVEASSPALIERVRNAVTDGTGQYQIIDLRPGTYTVTFTLTGFSTFKRESVEVAGAGVITINADLRVGVVTETVTVTAETPVVDVQSTKRQEVLTAEVVKAVPATRGYNGILAMIPSVMTSGFGSAGEQNNTQMSPGMTIFTSHGGRGNEGRVQVDGLNVGAAFNGGGVSGYIMDTPGATELQFTLTGGLGEAETGGINLNIVPKTGGNGFSGELFGATAGEWSQSDNIDAAQKAFGLSQNGLVKNWDLNGQVGGPIKRDRLWFYGNVRTFGTHNHISGAFGNKNAGDPTKWTYEKDPNLEVRSASAQMIGSLRLTGQVSPKNKVGAFYDNQVTCQGSALAPGASSWCRDRGDTWVALGQLFSGGVLISPEADTIAANRSPQSVFQATYSSTITSKLLFEAGYSSYVSRWGWMEVPGASKDLIQVTTVIPTVTQFRGIDDFFYNNQNANVWRASLSYVTGAHNMKFGYQGAYHIENIYDEANNAGMTYVFILPPGFIGPFPLNFITTRIAPWGIADRTGYASLYAQDQWTLGRLTLQGALRFDRSYSFYPAEGNGSPGGSPWHPAPITFPRSDGVRGYKDITTRVGAAYDLFGNGKTSIKFNIGKYLEAANNQGNYQIANPAFDGRNGRFQGSRFQPNAGRIWLDFDLDNNPDCDLQNPAGSFGGDVCGPWDNLAWGTVPIAVNPAILEGWGVRPHDWQTGISIQHEVAPRVSVELAYNRRWFGNFFVQDNLAVGPTDFDLLTFNAPRHSALPDGGGYPVSFWDVKPNKFGQVNGLYTFETDYAPARTAYWHGIDLTVNARLKTGLTFQGGLSTGRGVRNTCALEAALPELIAPYNNSNYLQPLKTQIKACDVTEPFLPQYRGLATYEIPKAEVQLSMSFRNVPGTFSSLINDGTTASNGFSQRAQYNLLGEDMTALGRSQANPQLQYDLLLPGERYSPRLTYVDFRVGKLLRLGRTRTLVAMDLYNLFNSNTPTLLQQGFGDGSAYNNPMAIQSPRVARFNVTVNF